MIPIASKQICRLQVKILKLPPLSSIGHYVMSDSFVTSWTAARKAPLSMGFLGKNTGVGCHLLQGIFPT